MAGVGFSKLIIRKRNVEAGSTHRYSHIQIDRRIAYARCVLKVTTVRSAALWFLLWRNQSCWWFGNPPQIPVQIGAVHASLMSFYAGCFELKVLIVLFQGFHRLFFPNQINSNWCLRKLSPWLQEGHQLPTVSFVQNRFGVRLWLFFASNWPQAITFASINKRIFNGFLEMAFRPKFPKTKWILRSIHPVFGFVRRQNVLETKNAPFRDR